MVMVVLALQAKDTLVVLVEQSLETTQLAVAVVVLVQLEMQHQPSRLLALVVQA
jgi:hypothetical protein